MTKIQALHLLNLAKKVELFLDDNISEGELQQVFNSLKTQNNITSVIDECTMSSIVLQATSSEVSIDKHAGDIFITSEDEPPVRLRLSSGYNGGMTLTTSATMQLSHVNNLGVLIFKG